MHNLASPEMQAVFLELDSHRDGLISQSELLTWYHGHVQPQLKRLANAKPAEPRRLSRWRHATHHATRHATHHATHRATRRASPQVADPHAHTHTRLASPRRRWLLSGRAVLLELPLYASLTARILLPLALAGMLGAAIGTRVPQAELHAQTDPGGAPVMRLSCNIVTEDGSYEELSAEDQCLTTPSGHDCCVTKRSFVQAWH